MKDGVEDARAAGVSKNVPGVATGGKVQQFLGPWALFIVREAECGALLASMLSRLTICN